MPQALVHMRAPLILAIASLLLMNFLAISTNAQQRSGDRSDSNNSVCANTPSSEQTKSALAPSEMPAGMKLHILAEGVIEKWPPDIEFMQLSALEFPPGAGIDSYSALGPSLYFVRRGETEQFVDGLELSQEELAQTAIPISQDYSIGSIHDEAASVLQLTFVSEPNKIISIRTAVATPQSRYETEPNAAPLASLELADVPGLPMRAFVGCLTLDSPFTQSPMMEFAGVTGLYTLEGTLGIDDDRIVAAEGCTLIDPGAAHQFSAPDGHSVALIFGAVADGDTIWTATSSGNADDNADFNRSHCGGQ